MFHTKTSFKNFKVYHLDVKSAFLNSELKEEVYAEQPEGVKQPGKEDYVWKLKKALYGLKRAPKAWYARLDNYLIQQGFKRSNANSNIYFKLEKDQLLITVVYVDDLIFGCNNDKLSHEFAEVMAREFEMSMIGELSFFLGLQISQSSKGIFISQSKYLKRNAKKNWNG